jgi:hypothetical protein
MDEMGLFGRCCAATVLGMGLGPGLPCLNYEGIPLLKTQ